MAELPERDAGLLLDMLIAARNAQQFIEGLDRDGFLESKLHQSAVIRAIEIIGEASSRVSENTRARHPEIPWRQVIAMRHKLIHGYEDVRLDVVWAVVRDDLPPLISALVNIVPTE
jgi:uncharacterized protein with HEPN domain